ncbi:hypothetical protein SAMN05660297_00237 [Natronincola peptidivorans]|uniref:YlxR domain-containing protein n=2 Tax=Natronincola peptidivorans TaxID=426128 RepID=A0A1H9YJ09_9FIRM|nr:hypothetical protein SAMN05660297_00237 [Natronincola peptidivorans]
MKSKKELIRIVHNKFGETNVDLTGKAHGRGAYICNNKHCFEKTKKSKILNRTFKADIEEAVYEKLIKEIDE